MTARGYDPSCAPAVAEAQRKRDNMSGPLRLSDARLTKINACIYGKAGAGKTVLGAGSQHLRTFIFDIDDGISSAPAFKGDPTAGILPCRTDLVTFWPKIKTKDAFFSAYSWFLNNQRHFDLVVIDSATELLKVFLREIMRRANHEIATIPEWGQVLNIMEELATQMRGLNQHVLWLCHEHLSESPEYRRTMYRPAFQGGFAQTYNRHFDLIARYTLLDQVIPAQGGQPASVRTYRYVQCVTDQFVECKDRSANLLKMEPVSIDYILAKMLMAIGRQQDQQAA